MGLFYTEIYEYALSNRSVASTAALLPTLLVKLHHAQLLADYGLNVDSQRYCDQIGASLKTTKQQVPPAIIHELQRLLVRVSDTGANDQSWYGGIGKINKMWGQLDKLISGDETTEKKGETGLFSKFSPSVSRNASTTDIHALDRPEFHSVVSSMSAPITPGEQYARTPGIPSAAPVTSLVGVSTSQTSNPLTSGPRYPPVTKHIRPQQSPLQPTRNHDMTSQSGLRYAPSNASLLNLMNPEEAIQSRKPLSKYSRPAQAGAFSYNNPVAQASSLSIGLYGSHPIPNPPSASHGHTKQPSFNSIVSNDYAVMRDHNRSPLVQSDISLDYPVDFRERIAELKQELEENKQLNETSSNGNANENVQAQKDQVSPFPYANQSGTTMESTETATQHVPPPPPKITQTPTHLPSRAPPPAVSRSPSQPPKTNPYAPGARTSKPRGKTRYGPPSVLGATAPGVPEANGNKANEAPEEQKNVSPKPVANIDDSFTSSYQEDSQTDLPLLMLNHNQGAINHTERPNSRFGLGDEFPIPGSPEVTTRANLVYGGHGGFFLSRLSQSQQSTMYQQYEVTDDTVQDYVPVVEEEDEEEEPKPQATGPVQGGNKAGGNAKGQTGLFSIFGMRKNDGKPKPIRAKMGEPMKLVYDEEMKAWIDPSIPRDQQLKKTAPPPPPKMKASAKSGNVPSGGEAPPQPQTSQTGPVLPPGSLGGPTPKPQIGSGPKPPAPRAGTKPQLANANLDDLLSLSSQPGVAGRKPKRGARRGYVNVMEQ
jgi:hypothetical protein